MSGKGDKVKASLLLRANVNVFREANGFELVPELSNKSSPLSLVLYFLEPTAGALRFLSHDAFSVQLAADLLKQILARLESLQDRDVKEIEKPTLDRMLNTLVLLQAGLDAASAKEFALATVFGVAMQLLDSTYIKKKLLGISTIRDMLPQTPQERKIFVEKEWLVSYEWKDPQKLLEAFENNGLIELLLGENANAELLRKVEPVFLFVLNSGKFLPRYVELLWKCSSEKHEDIMRASLGLFTEMSAKMSYPLLQGLFERIEKSTQYSEVMINFMESYTINVISLIIDREGHLPLPVAAVPGGKEPPARKQSSAVNYHLYNLDIFWGPIQDSSPTEGKIKDLCMCALIRILNKNTEMADEYVQKAVECIKARKTVIRSIQLLKDIDFAAGHSVAKKRPNYDLKGMNATANVVGNTIKDCEEYHAKVKLDGSTSPADIMNSDFGTGFPFSKQAALYIAFLEYYCSKGHVTLSNEELLRLWVCYVERAVCEQHANILYAALGKEHNPTRIEDKFVLFHDKTAKMFFDQVFCGPEHSVLRRLTQSGFACFKVFMQWANEKETIPTNFNSISNGTKSESLHPLLESFQGLPTLWTIAFESEREEIREQAREFLVSIVDTLCTKHKPRRREVTEKALQTALDPARCGTDPKRIKTALRIVDGIIEKYGSRSTSRVESSA